MAIQVLPSDVLHKVLDYFLELILHLSYGQYSVVTYPPSLPFSSILQVSSSLVHSLIFSPRNTLTYGEKKAWRHLPGLL